MSFIKKYLSDIESTIEAINDSPEFFYLGHNKVDTFIGPSDSIKLTDEFIQEYQENPEQDFRKLTAKYK